MNFSITERTIKKYCGTAASKKGRSYHLAGKVRLEPDSEDDLTMKATVQGRNGFCVNVKQTAGGKIDASCSCPPVGFVSTYCHHIAAVMWEIADMELKEQPLSEKMMELFAPQTPQRRGRRSYFENREAVRVEFSCIPSFFGRKEPVIGLQLKIGLDQFHEIEDLGTFLSKVEQGEMYESPSGFLYSPDIHSFDKETEEAIQFLLKSRHAVTETTRSENTLLLTPSDWERFLPLLQKAPFVRVVQEGQVVEDLYVTEELALSFHFDKDKSGGYRLDVEGLDQLLVAAAYETAFYNGTVIRLTADNINRLVQLKELMEGTEEQLFISPEQLEHFMEAVVPGLEQLGKVEIADVITERMVATPLHAKLFLDRIKHRLLAGVEFHYGQLVINPCEEPEDEFRHFPGIRRQRDQEQEIMKLMKNNAFTQTDGGFYMQDEEAEYDFLYHTIPKLEELLQVYATTAVKLRVQKAYAGPKIKVEVSERTDWLEFRFDLQGIPESEIQQMLLALKEKRKYYRIPNGTLLSLETAEFRNLHDFLVDLDVQDAPFNEQEIRVPLIEGMRMVETLEQDKLVDPGKTFTQLMKQLSEPEAADMEIPDRLRNVLRNYQKSGFSWFKLLAKYRFGGILADDMGLGKTLQSIAFILSVLPDIRNRQLPVLVVAPSSLTYNWLNELKKFAPSIRAAIIDGNKAKRALTIKESEKMDVLITSYPSLRMDRALYRKKQFHTLFLDEAQAFKNPVTQTAKAVKTIQADYRFALTGTPIENSLDELWSIFHVVFPELLPNRRAFSEMAREKVAKRVRPFILRRVKQEVLKELPEKVETVQLSELQGEQKKLYAAYLAELKHDALKHLNKDSFQKHRIQILAGLTRLRQLCCHPALFVEGYTGGSAKYDQLMEMLEEARLAGRRVLVFSQFTQMLGLIGRQLAKSGVPYFYLDGQTPPSERVELCSRFNEGEGNLFLISLKAGGTGLNLTGADTVILYDLWWNPAVEQQAADRAHRMGQEKEVQVIRMVAKGTIEEKITQLQLKKKNLVDEVIQSGQEPLRAMTEEDIREILMT
ncbi:DEAD/DEAH box helicase [Planococcus salinus]|uniref:Helicase SNF n=1 Tax=Planococcus salinus TaxID=1848460 RepID=A0A3M8P9N2_9BACL|nr:DEAD/DEAH box helicase [Planococcus salinus]RNF39894.1 helicase SNF [Planococcus salinus]